MVSDWDANFACLLPPLPSWLLSSLSLQAKRDVILTHGCLPRRREGITVRGSQAWTEQVERGRTRASNNKNKEKPQKQTEKTKRKRRRISASAISGGFYRFPVLPMWWVTFLVVRNINERTQQPELNCQQPQLRKQPQLVLLSAQCSSGLPRL